MFLTSRFAARSGGYEVNIFGDLNNPAAVQIGAMSYLSQDAGGQKQLREFYLFRAGERRRPENGPRPELEPERTEKNGGMTFETILPGEWGSYGGWWVSVYNDSALANAQASETELLAITQPRVGGSTAGGGSSTGSRAPPRQPLPLGLTSLMRQLRNRRRRPPPLNRWSPPPQPNPVW